MLKCKLAMNLKKTNKQLLDRKGSNRKQSYIPGWYCECKVGPRTVGCCAHVASVLWYLGYARNQPYACTIIVLFKNLQNQDAANTI